MPLPVVAPGSVGVVGSVLGVAARKGRMVEYFPERSEEWRRRGPGAAGFDPGGLRTAVDYHKTHDTPAGQVAHDFADAHPWDGDPEGLGAAIGPMPVYDEFFGRILDVPE